MTNEEIHKRIEELLDLIQINHNRMVLNESSFNLDLHQLRNHIVDLYSCLDRLEWAHRHPEEMVEELEEPVELPIEEVPVVQEIVPEKAEPPRKFTPEPVESIEDIQVETEPEVVEQPTPPVMEHLEPVVEKQAEPVVQKVAPKVNEKTNVSLKTSAGTEGDVYAQLRMKRLDTIKKGISISRRYEIQNKLFGNKSEAYNQVIQQLDEADNLKDALRKLEAVAAQNKWDTEHPLVLELVLLLERRYI